MEIGRKWNSTEQEQGTAQHGPLLVKYLWRWGPHFAFKGGKPVSPFAICLCLWVDPGIPQKVFYKTIVWVWLHLPGRWCGEFGGWGGPWGGNGGGEGNPITRIPCSGWSLRGDRAKIEKTPAWLGSGIWFGLGVWFFVRGLFGGWLGFAFWDSGLVRRLS